jgi:hypothetical protein
VAQATAQATWQRVHRSSSSLSGRCVRAMEELPWFGSLPPEQRSYVGLVVQAGLTTFAQWLRTPGQPLPVGPEVFAAAPRELARSVNLKQTVQLIRVAVGVVEDAVPGLAAPGDEAMLAEAVLRYSREIAFAAADVYASAAESRGAWDARVEAGVVDSLVRGSAGELTLSRATALGWGRVDWVVALAALAPADLDLPQLRAGARHSGLSLLTGEAATALVLVVGGTSPVDRACSSSPRRCPPDPVVIGPVVGSWPPRRCRCRRRWRAWPRACLAAGPAAGPLHRAAGRAGGARGGDGAPPAAGGGAQAAGGSGRRPARHAAAYLEGGGSVEGTGRRCSCTPTRCATVSRR